MWTSTFRVNSIGYRPLGLIFLGGTGGRGPGTRDQGRGTVGTSRGKRHDIEHIGLHWIHTFRVIFFGGGQGAGDRGQGTRDRGRWEQVEVRHDIEYIRLHWIQTFRVTFFRGERGPGTGDKGPGTAGTSRGKRHDIEHIGLHGTHTFRVNSFRGGQGTGKRIHHFMIPSCQHTGARGQDVDALEKGLEVLPQGLDYALLTTDLAAKTLLPKPVRDCAWVAKTKNCQKGPLQPETRSIPGVAHFKFASSLETSTWRGPAWPWNLS